MSPHQYLRLLRMERAGYLLETSFTRKVGVPDESHFSRDFKEVYGASPTRYRDACAEPALNEPTPCIEASSAND